MSEEIKGIIKSYKYLTSPEGKSYYVGRYGKERYQRIVNALKRDLDIDQQDRNDQSSDR